MRNIAIPLLAAGLLLIHGSPRAGVIRQDLGRMASLRNLGLAAGGLATAGLVHRFDRRVQGGFERSSTLRAISRFTDVAGDGRFAVPVCLGGWAVGKITGKDGIRAVSCDLIRALFYTQVVVSTAKISLHRTRPDGTNRRSFPSGHTANAFAVAGVLAHRVGPKAGVPMMFFGGLVGAGRIAGRKHFLSDVVGGATFGAVLGISVAPSRRGRASIYPMPGSRGLCLVVQPGL